MTQITVSNTKNNFTLELKGHAGYSAYGDDIVCASVSILAQTLVYRLQEISNNYSFKMSEAYLYVVGGGTKSMEAFHTIMTGIKAIARDYPEYVRVTYKNNLECENIDT